MSLREDVAALIRRLHGPYSTTEVGEALGRSRQAVLDLKNGAVSITRLMELERVYGVRFTIVALDPETGGVWNGNVAPGLVERIESGAPPALAQLTTGRGKRRPRPAPEVCTEDEGQESGEDEGPDGAQEAPGTRSA